MPNSNLWTNLRSEPALLRNPNSPCRYSHNRRQAVVRCPRVRKVNRPLGDPRQRGKRSTEQHLHYDIWGEVWCRHPAVLTVRKSTLRVFWSLVGRRTRILRVHSRSRWATPVLWLSVGVRSCPARLGLSGDEPPPSDPQRAGTPIERDGTKKAGAIGRIWWFAMDRPGGAHVHVARLAARLPVATPAGGYRAPGTIPERARVCRLGMPVRGRRK